MKQQIYLEKRQGNDMENKKKVIRNIGIDIGLYILIIIIVGGITLLHRRIYNMLCLPIIIWFLVYDLFEVIPKIKKNNYDEDLAKKLQKNNFMRMLVVCGLVWMAGKVLLGWMPKYYTIDEYNHLDKNTGNYMQYYQIENTFPEVVPLTASDYECSWFDGLMQAKAVYEVSFIADEEYIRKESERFEKYKINDETAEEDRFDRVVSSLAGCTYYTNDGSRVHMYEIVKDRGITGVIINPETNHIWYFHYGEY